jgi:hypothetical protein
MAPGSWSADSSSPKSTGYRANFGTYILHGRSYTEHVDFASDEISAGLVGKEQPFTVKVDGDTFTLTDTLSNGKALSETWLLGEYGAREHGGDSGDMAGAQSGRSGGVRISW